MTMTAICCVLFDDVDCWWWETKQCSVQCCDKKWEQDGWLIFRFYHHLHSSQHHGDDECCGTTGSCETSSQVSQLHISLSNSTLWLILALSPRCKGVSTVKSPWSMIANNCWWEYLSLVLKILFLHLFISFRLC